MGEKRQERRLNSVAKGQLAGPGMKVRRNMSIILEDGMECR